MSTCFPQKPKNLHESLFSCALSPYLLPVLHECPLPSLIILLFILLGLAPKHARQRILEVQDSRVAVCKGEEEITVTATLYILLCKEKGTVFRMSLTYKRARWQDTCVAQRIRTTKGWKRKGLQQALSASSLVFASNRQSIFCEASSTEKKTPAAAS